MNKLWKQLEENQKNIDRLKNEIGNNILLNNTILFQDTTKK